MIEIKIPYKKNLLAFSAGVDSSALFLILQQNNIPFDIAIVDYNLREQSKKEVAYAKELAKKYNKKVFLKEVFLKGSNIEKKARDIRYSFFEEIIKKEEYETLITAHQLNDKLEWFLMQLSKGAGLSELIGLQKEDKSKSYTILKPLLDYSRDELLEFLEKNSFKYFEDESNEDFKYKRNIFRHKFSNDFIKEYKDGVKNSFEYLENDLKSLNIDNTLLLQKEELEIFRNINDDNLNIRVIDKSIKKRGYILSKNQRDEVFKQKEIVIDKFAISIQKDFIWISPSSDKKMDKKFKEFCRIKKIPQKNRAYLSSLGSIKEITNLLQFEVEQ